jgi:hypothetical protein
MPKQETPPQTKQPSNDWKDEAKIHSYLLSLSTGDLTNFSTTLKQLSRMMEELDVHITRLEPPHSELAHRLHALMEVVETYKTSLHILDLERRTITSLSRS